MMKIQSMHDCGRGRWKIVAVPADDPECNSDSEFADEAIDDSVKEAEVFYLTRKDIRLFRLSEGEVLLPQTWQQIISFLRKSCLQKSGDLLSRQDYSRLKLREKLLRGYPAIVVDPVLDELERAHYLDDARYARSYVRARMYERSRMRIRQDLIQKGIEEGTAQEALSLVFGEADESGEDPEREQIRRLLRKKQFDPQTSDWNERQKIMASIYRRGFSADKIRSVMQQEVASAEQGNS